MENVPVELTSSQQRPVSLSTENSTLINCAGYCYQLCWLLLSTEKTDGQNHKNWTLKKWEKSKSKLFGKKRRVDERRKSDGYNS